MSETKLRRFNEVILLIARKNGKTTFIAGIDLAEFFLSKGVDIVCASNTSEQANILFDEINNMREASPTLEKRTSKNIFCIKFGKKNDKRSSLNKSKIKKMSAQSKNKDGYNIEVGCIDEVHEMTDSKVYDAIKQSQSTKKEPLIFIITTEGVTVGGFLDSKLEYARKIIKGEIGDERVLPWLYTQDSQEEIFNDPKTWIKSNPSLGEIKQVSYLEDLMNKSKNDLATRVTMLCKDFNIKQTEDGSWLNFKDIENKDTFKIEDLRGSYAIGGVDLSSTTDLTAAVLYIEKQGKKYLISHFFMPSDVLKDRIQEDSVPYDIWVKKGYITLTEGSQNDFSLVTQWFRLVIDKYDIRPLWVGYDPWNSQYWVKEMEDMGFEMEKIRQGVYTLSEPMKQLEADLKNHELNYNNNPIMKWCLANTQAKVDINGNIQPSKLDSRLKRIDGTVATIIAYATLSRYKLDYESMTT
jgi:phage terminase large subunit-like protein